MWSKKEILRTIGVGVVVLSLGILGLKTAMAEDMDEYQASDALLKALPSSKHTLADGISQAAQGGEKAVSAKFEMDDGKLSLSVYTADAANNTFKEVAGDAEAATWSPQAEVIKEGEDLQNAKEQLKVLTGSKFSLLDFIAKAQKDQPGTVLSAIPEVEGGKSVCEVRIVSQGKVIEIHYDVTSGEKANVE